MAADNNDLIDLIDQPGDSGTVHVNSKLDKLCRDAIRKLGNAQAFWGLVIFAAIITAGTLLFFASERDTEKMFKPSGWGWEQNTTLVTLFILIVLAITRITSNGAHLKELKDAKKYLSDGLPTEADITMREVYFYYCKRRCVHFWLSFGFGALFALCILYCFLAAGIDMAAHKSWKPTKVKIHEMSEWSSISSWKLPQKFIVFGFVGMVLDFVQYIVLKDTYVKYIDALEHKYGKDQIIDECLYCHRMFKVNFRYKSFAFMIIAFLGCFFYLFTKRFICTMFDKSCTY